MQNLKQKFKNNEWNLVEHILNVGKNDSWRNLATTFKIKPEGNSTQRLKAANDIWRKFNKLLSKNNLDLETVKQTLNGNGEILFETKKRLPKEIEYDISNMEIDKVTTNPHGGEWITYKNKIEVKQKEDILESVKKLMGKYASQTILNEPDSVSSDTWFGKGKLAVVNLYDAHLDKIPIKSTCGVESSTEQNCEIFLSTIDKICSDLQLTKINGVIFPVGNDLFHTNGFNSQTKKGTNIEYYGSPEDNYYKVSDAITQAILKLSKVTDKVKVIMVKGNHDEDKITVLGYWLEKVFRDINVEVDYLRKQRKYIQFGENLIGFAHGDKEKSKIAQLPLIMATESKEMWGKTTHRKMYLGDLHHGFEYQFMKAKDQPGVEVEYLRSVGTTDTWHEDFGWIGVPKTAYLQIFDSQEGEELRKKYNIK